MEKKVKYKHIHSKRVRNILVNNFGHTVIYEEKSKINPTYYVYLFEETEKLLDDLTIITLNYKKKHKKVKK